MKSPSSIEELQDNAKLVEGEDAKPMQFHGISNEECTGTIHSGADYLPSEEIAINNATIVEQEEEVGRQWKESPFAVGQSGCSWEGGASHCTEFRSTCPQEKVPFRCCTTLICGRLLGAERVGNMIVLWKTWEDFEFPSGEKRRRPKILRVVGPFWPVPVFVTMPSIIIVSTFIILKRMVPNNVTLGVQISWAIFTAGLIISLIQVSTLNPGILYRHLTIPPGENESLWRWNDQAYTYRPHDSRFDAECLCVIEKFDHVCPWTGTAIGKRNMPWFRSFLLFATAVVVYDAALLSNII